MDALVASRMARHLASSTALRDTGRARPCFLWRYEAGAVSTTLFARPDPLRRQLILSSYIVLMSVHCRKLPAIKRCKCSHGGAPAAADAGPRDDFSHPCPRVCQPSPAALRSEVCLSSSSCRSCPVFVRQGLSRCGYVDSRGMDTMADAPRAE